MKWTRRDLADAYVEGVFLGPIAVAHLLLWLWDRIRGRR